MFKIILATICIIFGACQCLADGIVNSRYRVTNANSTRLSTMQAFVYSAPAVVAFLAAPGQAYIQGCVLFPTTFPSDGFAVLDESFLDGTVNPLYNSQGDWDALIELQQNGNLWVASGPTPGASPTTATFQIINLGAAFQKGQWYLARLIANVNTRKFVSLQIKGPGINSTTDISAFNINWVQNFNVDKRSMIYAVGAYRSASFQASAANADGSPVVFWDRISAGIPGSPDQVLFHSDFNGQPNPLLSPFAIGSGPFTIASATDSLWYNSSLASRSSMTIHPIAMSPPHIGYTDASLWN